MPALRGALGALLLPGTARLCKVQVVGAAVRRMSSAGRGEGGQPLGGKQPLTTPTYIVWGAGTDVGKTLVSAALCNFMSRKAKDKKVLFLKPYQTGFPVDSDADTVALHPPVDLHGEDRFPSSPLRALIRRTALVWLAFADQMCSGVGRLGPPPNVLR